MAEPLPAVGRPAPAFTLPTGEGGTCSLADYRGRWLVLYFYPKDDTPGCTKEACAFQAHLAARSDADVAVVGVSRDTPASHRRFARTYRLTFPLLSDAGASVSRAYGVYTEKLLYGRRVWGIERTTFVIDPAGRLAAIFPRVVVEGHAAAVWERVRAARQPAGPRAAPEGGGPSDGRAIRPRAR